MELEFQRNKERFAFLKWGSTAFRNMLVVPPGSGIVHQVNLEIYTLNDFIEFNRSFLIKVGDFWFDVLDSRSILNILEGLYSTMRASSILTVWLELIHIQL